MVDCKAKIAATSGMAPKLPDNLRLSVPPPSSRGGESSTLWSSAAYENYLRLPELRKLWSSREFQKWRSESILKPALQGLEITFRFVSTVVSDPRLYANRREWKRRLESLATNQIQLIAVLCEEGGEEAPIMDSRSSEEVLSRGGSTTEVWKLSGEKTVVSRTSEASLLPRLASWERSEDVAEKMMYSIECEMRGCPYTLGLGEPNLAGKPTLDYDSVCKPSELHALKNSPPEPHLHNRENQTLYAAQQILESWIRVAGELLSRIRERIEAGELEEASSDCWLLERIWKLLAEVQGVYLLVDPDDFLRLKSQLSIKFSESEPVFCCFGSDGLAGITEACKELKHRVPHILGVEVDPEGRPRIQEAAMELYRGKRGFEKIHLLQGLQAIESGLKRFFYAYRQVVAVAMGSLEVNGNRSLVCAESCDSLSRIFLEPTYFPSLDAAKTFLGDFWEHKQNRSG